MRLAESAAPQQEPPNADPLHDRPLLKLETRYPTMAAPRNTPSSLSGSSKVRRTEGQATPRTPSGRPRLTNARNPEQQWSLLSADFSH